MSNVIDERVVEMRLDNQNFETNAQTSLSTIDRLSRALNLTGVKSGLDSVSSSFNGMRGAVEGISEKFNALGVIARTALTNITNQVVNTGKRMLSSLTIAPISQGYHEYELKMNSVQTIMASTGEKLSTVNKYLNELNTYADKTIYSFSDMTSNIGKFTNAGVKLNDAVLAIQGISNEAAVSGANANEASRAMYNFAQALSAGYVKLIDWKSIELANMGTVEFKQQLIDTAVAMGTLVKAGDKYVSTTTDMNGKTAEAFDASHQFNESLSAQWMTTDVLVKTLGKYADETTDIGKKAFKAAQDVKTFSQLMDTLKESVGSGWAMTFEILFGDLEEAKVLWTSVNNVVGTFINAQSNARNNLLQGWKDLGGRTKLIDALTNAFNGLVSVIKPIRQAFKEIFPGTTARQLYSLTDSFHKFTEKLKLSRETSENLKATFKGLFSILDVGKRIITAGLKLVSPALSLLGAIGSGVLSITAKFANLFTGIDKSGGAVEKFVNKILSSLRGFEQGISAVINVVKSAFSYLINTVGSAMRQLLDALNLDDVFNIAGGGLMLGIGAGIKGIIKNLGEFVKNLRTIGDDAVGFVSVIKDILIGVKDTLVLFQQEIKSKILLKIAAAVAILAVSLVMLSNIKFKSLLTGLTGVAGIMLMMTISMKSVLGVIESFAEKGRIKALAKGVRVMHSLLGTVAVMAASVLLLSSAVKKLASLNYKELATGLAGVVGLMVSMVASLWTLSAVMNGKSFKAIKKGASSFMVFAAAIVVLSSALAKLSTLNPAQLISGLTAVFGLCTSLGASLMLVAKAFELYSNAPSSIMAMAAAVVAVSAAVLVLSAAMKKLSAVKPEQLVTGTLALADILLMIVGFTKSLASFQGASGELVKISAGLGLVSVSILALTNAVSTLGKLNFAQLTKGLSGAAAVLAGITVFLKYANTSSIVPAGQGLVLLATSLVIFSSAISLLGKQPIKVLVTGLISLAAAFGVLAGACVFLEHFKGSILQLSKSMALLGVSAAAFGAGMLLISSAIAAFGGSARLLAQSIVDVLVTIITALPNMLSALATSVTKSINSIAKLIQSFFKALLMAFDDLVPMAVDSLLNFVTTVLSSLSEHLSDIVGSLVDLIVEVIEGVATGAPKIISAAVDLLKSIIDATCAALGEFDVETVLKAAAALAAFGVLMTELTAVAGVALLASIILKPVGTNLSKFAENIQPFINALKGLDPAVLEGAKNLAKTLLIITAAGVLDAITSWLTGGSSFVTFGQQLVAFGLYLRQFASIVSGMDVAAVESAANAAKMLTGLYDNLPKTGGLFQMFTGAPDLGLFGSQLVSLGKGMKAFSVSVTGLNAEAVSAAATGAMMLASLYAKLPPSGGAFKIFTGAPDLGEFGSQLVKFGKGMKSFSMSVAGINPEAVTAAATAGGSLAALAGKIPATGGIFQIFTGAPDLEQFGSQLTTLGSGIRGFANKVNGIAPKSITAAATAGGSLAALANSLPKSGGWAQKIFGEKGLGSLSKGLPSFGSAIAGYTASITKVGVSEVNSAIKSGKAVVSFINSLNGLDSSAAGNFKKSLSSLGSSGVSSFVNAFKNANGKARQAAATFINSFTSGINSRKSSVTSAAKGIGNALKNGISSGNSSFSQAGTTAINRFISALNKGKGKAGSAGKNAAKAAKDGARSYYKSFYNAGSYLVSGFANGINDNTYRARARAQAMAAAAAEAARKELAEHSPSRVGFEIGDYFGRGFVNGIDVYSLKAYKAGAGMASSAKDGLSRAISEINASIDNSIDAEPMIRPVLDISNIEKGSRRISTLLGHSSAMTINSEMNSRGTAQPQDMNSNRGIGGSQFNFTQNNYSPKALSRIDIYRQTKNQFTAMKEALERI